MQCVDLVALSFLPASPRKLFAAVACADALDGRLESALLAAEFGPRADAPALRQAAESALATAARSGFRYVALGDPTYPPLLTAIPDPPIGLWVRGAFADSVAVAIVGSRSASPAALEIASTLAAGLARHGFCIVSGLARGCDASAHRGAIDGEGSTIAVLGSGLDVMYPAEHQGLADRIVACGALLSEFPPGTPPLPLNFPLRNRIISGLSRAVIVVEAGEKSGSLITAGCALEHGREVMVVPGPVLSGRNRGAHALLRDGATLVESVEDVLQALAGLGLQSRSQKSDPLGPLPDPTPGDLLLDALDRDDGRDLDDLVGRTGLSAAELLVRLTRLELAGEVGRHPGGRFVRLGGKVVT